MLRHAMGLFPTGVTVVTTGRDERAEGMTANSVVSVSLEPLLVLVSIHEKSRVYSRIRQEGNFALNILAEDQREISNLFASPDRLRGAAIVDRLGGRYGQTGVPLIEGVLAAIECELVAVYSGGDHGLCLGRVANIHPGDEEKGPLLFYRRTYASVKR